MSDIISSIPLPSQDNWLFVEELKQEAKRSFALAKKLEKPTVSLSQGVKVIPEANDPENVLKTAYEDLNSFWQELGIPQGNYPIITRIADCGPYDSFKIVITETECIIYGSNLEGIRRGIFYLEDLILGNGIPALEIETIHKKAWVEQRISRCFFGPIKRPPHNRDELLDQYDYYPDAYLNRLAHEGINGLWLTITFKDLCRTSFAPTYGQDAPQRLAKLKRTVDQCLRYGIKTYIFTIEPACFNTNDPILKEYPELAGAKFPGDRICFCPSSDTAYRYLYESVNYIFTAVPKLGGLINISFGERCTTCLSSIHSEFEWSKQEGTVVQCPRCSKLPHNEIIYNSISAMTAGMKAASPDAKLISWNYIPNMLDQRDWAYTLHKMPEGATAMWNFESGGEQIQLGKKRVGGDYWLSYVGPSHRFERFAKESPAPIGAKLQVGCSHELATVPYVPVPGLLYQKYKAMHRLGVNTVMQCWYFGNYPGIMNKAAGLLSFEDFSHSEHEFLAELLRPYWGKHTEIVANVYQKCSQAYSNYPLSNAVQYYGPFHDGVVWPLYCNEQNLPLAPTWQTNHPISGDAIGESLDNHSLEEVTELARLISSQWTDAVEEMLKLKSEYANNIERIKDINLLNVLDYHFVTAYDIFKFYCERSKNCGVTPLMKEILQSQIKISLEVAELCKKDSRIGFHSEAENYKYFPEKLIARAKMLEMELNCPTPKNSCSTPLAYGNKEHQADTFSWKLEYEQDHLKINVTFYGKSTSDQVMVTLSENSYTPILVLDLNKKGFFFPNKTGSSFNIIEKSEDCWEASFTVPYNLFTSNKKSFRISFARNRFYDGQHLVDCDPPLSAGNYRLWLGMYKPQYMYEISEK